MNAAPPQRLLPERELPPYAHVPGLTPHPVRDPHGHAFAQRPEPIAFATDRWHQCQPYLYGIDLFNHGYYWEAHEAWEQVWLAAGRQGPVADFVKALIKLAAAGVKHREGSARGQRRHAARALQLLRQVSGSLADPPPGERWLMGLSLERLIADAEAAGGRSCGAPDPCLFSLRLVPRLPA